MKKVAYQIFYRVGVIKLSKYGLFLIFTGVWFFYSQFAMKEVENLFYYFIIILLQKAGLCIVQGQESWPLLCHNQGGLLHTEKSCAQFIVLH